MRIALPPTLAPDAFAGHDPAAVVIALDGETMGTTWQVRYAARDASRAAAVRTAIVSRLAGLVAEMSHWSASSLLSRFNRAAAGTWVRLPRDFDHVIARGMAIAQQTGGAFDPTIGALVNLWGFGPPATSDRYPHPSALRTHSLSRWQREMTPNVGKGARDGPIEATRSVSGHYRLACHRRDRLLRQPGGLSLDLSGIAKGHAVDAIVDLLAAQGIAHCLVEIGGELVGRGLRPDGDPWWVDLEAPPGVMLPPLRIALHGLAVATSGDYRRGAHTIDPRTGYPIDHGVVSCSVIHARALDADAWATALTVLGVTDGVALATRAEIAARWVVVDDGVATEHLSPALLAMLTG